MKLFTTCTTLALVAGLSLYSCTPKDDQEADDQGDAGAPDGVGGSASLSGGGGTGAVEAGAAGSADVGGAGGWGGADEGGAGARGGGDAGQAGSAGGGDEGSDVPHVVLWQEGFEGAHDWSVEGGQWAFGTPTHASEPAPLSGTRVAATVLGGNYVELQNALLLSPEFTVPDAGLNPRIKFNYWYDVSDDYGQVQVRVDGEDWQDVPGARVTRTAKHWAQSIVDLRAFAGKSVQLGFRFVSNLGWSGVATGWYIDDVSLETGSMAPPTLETFEAGYGDWSVEGGMWAIGKPTLPAEPVPQSGERLMATVPGGDYFHSQSARLASPEFAVPAASAAPKLKYFYWYSLADDLGQLQVRVDGGAWTNLGDPITGAGGTWSQRLVDLKPYRGKRVQLGFLLTTDFSWSGVSLGWYIDDVSLIGF